MPKSDLRQLGVWLYVAVRYRAALKEGLRRGQYRHRREVLLSWLYSLDWAEVKRSAQFVTYKAGRS